MKINKIDGFPTAEEAVLKQEGHSSQELNLIGLICFISLERRLVGTNLIEKDTKENFNSFKKIFNNLKNEVIKNFEAKDNTDLKTRNLLIDLFEKLRKEHKV